MQKKNFIKGTSVEERIVDLYILIIFCFYPLYISNYFLGGHNIKYLLFIIITFICSIIIVFKNIRVNSKIEKQSNKIEWLILSLVVITAVIRISNGLDTFTKTTELAAIAAYGLGYFAVAEHGRARGEHLHFFLCSAAVTCIALIPGAFMRILQIGYFQKGGNLAAYFLLVLTVAMPLYLQEKKRLRKIFYFIMCAAMVTLLLISEEKGALLMLPVLFLLCVIFLRARLYVFKGLLHLLLADLIIFKIVALIIEYSGLKIFTAGITHDVCTSVFVDIALVTAALVYSLFLDNTMGFTPRQMKQSYPNVRIITMKGLEFSLFLITISLLLCNRIVSLKVVFGTKWFVSFLQFVQNLMQKSEAAYAQILEKGGLFALILLLLILLTAIDALMNSPKHNDLNRVFRILLTAMVIQNFFYPLQEVTTPIYMIIIALTFGIGKKTEEENVEVLF